MPPQQVGDDVIFTDNKGNDHKAWVTAWWSEHCCNVVYVSSDTSRTDSYGRQLERATSVGHVSQAGAHGNYFRLPGEAKKDYAAPVAV